MGYACNNTQETVLSIVAVFIQVMIFSFLLGILLHHVSPQPAPRARRVGVPDTVQE
jgi:hypothetical protein